MKAQSPGTTPRRLSPLRRLDYLPAWPAVGLGFGGGALLGAAALTWVSPVVGGALFVILLAGAVLVAYSGEPITVLTKPDKPESPPRSPEMVRVPAGRFAMGSPEDEADRNDDEGPVHEVRLSAFEMMRVPVTRRLYAEVMDAGHPAEEADERPVTGVSWFDAVRFCNRLSEREGLEPCYRIDGEEKVLWEEAANGYRLPTEAEWEYACRAGTTTRFFFGNDEQALDRYAWYYGNSGGETHPVGRKDPNSWGLYDMHGNVYEWCWDWYGPYAEASQTDPRGPSEGQSRVLRGGAFWYVPRSLRSARRDRDEPELRSDFVGFRCVRRPRRQP